MHSAKKELDRAKKILENVPQQITDIMKKIMHIPECDIGGVSRLSSFVSYRMEQILIDYFNSTCSSNELSWKRYEGKFPDIQITTRGDGEDTYTGHGLEIKVVCDSCEEPSARFWHDVSNFKDYESEYVVILAWKLTENTSGYPCITKSVCIDAKKLAEDRDSSIHNPPQRLVIRPTTDENTKENQRQTDIKVKVFQEKIKYEEACAIVSSYVGDPQELVALLTRQFVYRDDSNAGKLNRIKNKQLSEFITSLKPNKTRMNKTTTNKTNKTNTTNKTDKTTTNKTNNKTTNKTNKTTTNKTNNTKTNTTTNKTNTTNKTKIQTRNTFIENDCSKLHQ
jgi:hypothetical protein